MSVPTAAVAVQERGRARGGNLVKESAPGTADDGAIVLPTAAREGRLTL
jgi:hypothetical protein